MKKVVSLILVLVMVFAMSTTAFAVTKDVVGNYNGTNGTKQNDYQDGAADFGDTPAGADVEIKVTAGSVNHRYAVDITYQDMVFNVAGTNVYWDVNDMQYETVDGGTVLTDTTFPVSVKNYSDLPVYLTVTAKTADGSNGGVAAPAEISVGAYAVDGNGAVTDDVVGEKTEIGDALSGEATEYKFAVKVSATDWDAVANYYLPQLTVDGEEIVVGTVSVTISKTAS